MNWKSFLAIIVGGALVGVALAPLAAAAQTEFCDVSPGPDCACRDSFGQAIEDFQNASSWMPMYCAGGGALQEKRTALEIVKPECVSRIETALYQQVQQPFCKKCPDPKEIGSWSAVGCAGNKTIYQRSVIAYYFTTAVEDCELGRFTEFKVESDGACSTAFGTPALWFSNNALGIAFGVVLIVIAGIFYKKVTR